jgi:glyoxylase-like metal-dependent hydrolase (beta-lactamase superfamily II)
LTVTTPTKLAEGVLRFQSPQWQTNSLLVVRDGHALVVDPAWTPAEIDGIHAAAAAAARELHFVLTHADPDHVCGMEAFRDARIHVESRSAALIDEGLSGRVLHETGADWGIDFPFEPRYDAVFEVGAELSLGPFRIVTLDAAGHMLDGAAYLLLDEGILVPGDYLCSIGSPLVFWSVSAAAATIRRLLDALDRYDVAWVVPGHGHVLGLREARAMGVRDLEYLEALESTAAEARDAGLAWAEALVRLMTVAPPRPNGPDVEIYTPSYLAARRALIDVGCLRPGETPPRIGLQE